MPPEFDRSNLEQQGSEQPDSAERLSLAVTEMGAADQIAIRRNGGADSHSAAHIDIVDMAALSKPHSVPAEGGPAVENIGAKPTENTGAKPTENTGAKPAENTGAKTAEKPADKPAEKPAAKPTEKPADKPAHTATEEKSESTPASSTSKDKGTEKTAGFPAAGTPEIADSRQIQPAGDAAKPATTRPQMKSEATRSRASENADTTAKTPASPPEATAESLPAAVSSKPAGKNDNSGHSGDLPPVKPSPGTAPGPGEIALPAKAGSGPLPTRELPSIQPKPEANGTQPHGDAPGTAAKPGSGASSGTGELPAIQPKPATNGTQPQGDTPAAPGKPGTSAPSATGELPAIQPRPATNGTQPQGDTPTAPAKPGTSAPSATGELPAVQPKPGSNSTQPQGDTPTAPAKPGTSAPSATEELPAVQPKPGSNSTQRASAQGELQPAPDAISPVGVLPPTVPAPRPGVGSKTTPADTKPAPPAAGPIVEKPAPTNGPQPAPANGNVEKPAEKPPVSPAVPSPGTLPPVSGPLDSATRGTSGSIEAPIVTQPAAKPGILPAAAPIDKSPPPPREEKTPAERVLPPATPSSLGSAMYSQVLPPAKTAQTETKEPAPQGVIPPAQMAAPGTLPSDKPPAPTGTHAGSTPANSVEVPNVPTPVRPPLPVQTDPGERPGTLPRVTGPVGHDMENKTPPVKQSSDAVPYGTLPTAAPQPQFNNDRPSQPQVNTERAPQPVVNVDRTPQPQVNTDRAPQSQYNPERTPQPQYNSDRTPQPQYNSDRAPQPQYNSDRAPQPPYNSDHAQQAQVNTDRAPQPQYNNDRPAPVQPAFNTDRPTQPQLNFDRTPQTQYNLERAQQPQSSFDRTAQPLLPNQGENRPIGERLSPTEVQPAHSPSASDGKPGNHIPAEQPLRQLTDSAPDVGRFRELLRGLTEDRKAESPRMLDTVIRTSDATGPIFKDAAAVLPSANQKAEEPRRLPSNADAQLDASNIIKNIFNPNGPSDLSGRQQQQPAGNSINNPIPERQNATDKSQTHVKHDDTTGTGRRPEPAASHNPLVQSFVQQDSQVHLVVPDFAQEEKEEEREEEFTEFKGFSNSPEELYAWTLFHDKNAKADSARKLSTRRTKYVVVRGDTLEKIAEDQLKDRRFATVILSINRATIQITVISGKQIPIIREGQVLWLPSEAERALYAKVAFSSQTKRGNQAPYAVTPSGREVSNPITPVGYSANLLTPNSGEIPNPVLIISEQRPAIDSVQNTITLSNETLSAPVPVYEAEERTDQLRRSATIEGRAMHGIAPTPPLMPQSRSERTESHAEEAEHRSEQAEHRSEQAEHRSEQAEHRSEQAEHRSELLEHQSQEVEYLLEHQSRAQRTMPQFFTEDAMGEQPVLVNVPGPKSLFERLSQIATAGQRKPARSLELEAYLAQRNRIRNAATATTLSSNLQHESVEATTGTVSPNPTSTDFRRPSSSGTMLNQTQQEFSIDVVGEWCRIVTIRQTSIPGEFTTSLQMQTAGRWNDVATYEYRHGHGYRYNFYSLRNERPFTMDLPIGIIMQMAQEDFHRNWSQYCREFAMQHYPSGNGVWF